MLKESNVEIKEKQLKYLNGWLALSVIIAISAVILSLGILAVSSPQTVWIITGTFTIILAIAFFVGACCGSVIISPNQAGVALLFGKYKGTIKKDGFYWINPFCRFYNPSKKLYAGSKLSLKTMTLNNEKQKVNDCDGNPLEIGVIAIWKIIDTAKAVFNVEDYVEFVSIQTDSSIRQVARMYPYDSTDSNEEMTLRGSSQEVAIKLREELQSRVADAGIEIVDTRISHLAYAPEIAAAMLQRQQAKAIIDARQKIVEGAVGMVEMALEKLNESNMVSLDDERKAQMVSNLLVVLCGNKDTQPIVNAGTLF